MQVVLGPPSGPRQVWTHSPEEGGIFPQFLLRERREARAAKTHMRLGLEETSAPGERPLLNPQEAWGPSEISFENFYAEGSLT